MSKPNGESEKPKPHTAEAGVSDESRRRFMRVGIGVLGTGLAGVVAVPALRFAAFPLGTEVTSKLDAFLPAGKASSFGETPTKVDVFADRVDAWSRTEQVKVGSAWLARRGEEWVALSTVCPHLGCAVAFAPDAGEFQCPCHTSAFDLDGARKHGPAPRGMDRLEAKEENGLIQIRYQRFRQGTDTKEPV